jgi:hypothetical protein
MDAKESILYLLTCGQNEQDTEGISMVAYEEGHIAVFEIVL